MKKISAIVLIVVVAAVTILSCSQSENVNPTNQKSLGLVVTKANYLNVTGNGYTRNSLLLKDGRTANPVSGIPNFEKLPIGSKLSLEFTTGATHDGIVDITVIKAASAEDSTFTQPNPDSVSFIGKRFTGTASKFNLDDSTQYVSGTATITFNAPNLYSCTGTNQGYPQSGNGTFVVWHGMITFIDGQNTSANVLNGSFTYSRGGGYLYFWAVRNRTYYSFTLKEQ
ncbi:hypothetical protein WSM22_06990 [Cytophagales bacterium WSM2-2]|nr:hypothetical protein WSM22_06990 [Cytophagales bacterium WSM2-2]